MNAKLHITVILLLLLSVRAEVHAQLPSSNSFAQIKFRAEQGDPEAQNNLGAHYDKGQSVAKDAAEAVKWYRKAAEQNYGYAQYNLGYCYDNGIGVTKDATEAVRWYREAAKNNNAWAQCNLGMCYYEGRGVTKDVVEAVSWYRKAAEQNNPPRTIQPRSHV